jgi:lipid-A-disaccharide synthase
MRAAGVRLLAETVDLTAVGALGYLRMYPRAWVRYRLLLRALDRHRPDVLVPIDSGGFNVPLIKAVKRRLGTKVVYYVPPRSWSRTWRMAPLAEVVDYFATPFPWNAQGDDGTGRVRFVGHPAADWLRGAPSRDEARRELGLKGDRLTLSVLPGSRRWELGTHLGVVAETVRLLRAELPSLQVLVSRAPALPAKPFADALRRVKAGELRAVEGVARALRAADAALVCMGTATLEACALGTPMVTFYRVSRGTLLQLLFWKPPARVALPNIIADREVVPERLQDQANPAQLAADLRPLLTDPEAARRAREGLVEVMSALGGPGAADRAAEAVRDALEGTWFPMGRVPSQAP